jgi:hypothetical protein
MKIKIPLQVVDEIKHQTKAILFEMHPIYAAFMKNRFND